MNQPSASSFFKRHPAYPELWLHMTTGELWTSKVGTNTPRVLDHPVRAKNLRTSADGYKRVAVRRRGMSWPLLAHRVIAECLTGAVIEPGMVIDHIDGNRSNNSPGNLRLVRPADNVRNMTRTPRHNRSSGLIGVSYYRRTGRWMAYIVVNNKQRHLGYFATRDEARNAYLAAKKEYHGIPQSNLDSSSLVISQ